MTKEKEAIIELLKRDDIEIIDIEPLMEEIQPSLGSRQYQLTGVSIITILNHATRAKRQEPRRPEGVTEKVESI